MSVRAGAQPRWTSDLRGASIGKKLDTCHEAGVRWRGTVRRSQFPQDEPISKWPQFGEPRFDRPGIGAVVPGVSRLTQIFRPRKLAAKVRTIDLNAAFVARAGLDA
jgi:hypothetical protein